MTVARRRPRNLDEAMWAPRPRVHRICRGRRTLRGWRSRTRDTGMPAWCRSARRTPSREDCRRRTADRSRAALRRLLFCLLQPVRHPHLAVHRRRGGEVLPRLLAFAGAPVELAEAEVAVSDEGAHADFTSMLWTTRLAASARRGDRPCRSPR